LIDFDNLSSIGNRNEYCTKCVQTVLLQPDYVSTIPGKTKNNTKKLTAYAVHSVKPIVSEFCRKPFNIRFFKYLLKTFFSSLLTENLLHSLGFYQKFIFKLNMGNFSM